MPAIKVWCLPPNQSEEALRNLHKKIVKAVCSIRELGFENENDMTVLFPPDQMMYGLGTDIFIEISGILKGPEKTNEVLDRLSESVGKVVEELFPDSEIKCKAYPFEENYGFWTNVK